MLHAHQTNTYCERDANISFVYSYAKKPTIVEPMAGINDLKYLDCKLKHRVPFFDKMELRDDSHAKWDNELTISDKKPAIPAPTTTDTAPSK